MSGTGDWLTLRELDARNGTSKGAAFRAFKRVEPKLKEGADFRVLHAGRDATEIAALRDAGRIYRSSVNVVLVSSQAARHIMR